MNDIGLAFKGLWIVIGDFNVVLDQRNKKGDSLIASTNNSGFRNMIKVNNRMDLRFMGSSINWSNRRVGNININESLDRAFANGE